LILGMSAGSQVGTVVASGLPWEHIWARQVAPVSQTRQGTSADMSALFRQLAQIQADAKTPEEWLLSQGALSEQSLTVSEADRLGEVEQRLQLTRWPERLGVVGVNTRSGKRAVWTKDSGVELIRAVAASSAVPGVYPAVTIDGHQYCDGGVYSMENADLVEGYAKVLILCVGLPIPTPYTLDQQVESLRRAGAEVEVIQPDQTILSVLKQMGGNPLNPELRAPVARAAKTQGRSLAEKIGAFWDFR